VLPDGALEYWTVVDPGVVNPVPDTKSWMVSVEEPELFTVMVFDCKFPGLFDAVELIVTVKSPTA
jgi:hypothetical protein